MAKAHPGTPKQSSRLLHLEVPEPGHAPPGGNSIHVLLLSYLRSMKAMRFGPGTSPNEARVAAKVMENDGKDAAPSGWSMIFTVPSMTMNIHSPISPQGIRMSIRKSYAGLLLRSPRPQ